MACLDTDLLVGLVRNDERAVIMIKSLERDTTPLFTTAITAYELLKGARMSKNKDKNVDLIKTIFDNLYILDLDSAASETAASLYQELLESGKLIGEFDLLIAAICLSNEQPLISNDVHFSNIEGLKVKNW